MIGMSRQLKGVYGQMKKIANAIFSVKSLIGQYASEIDSLRTMDECDCAQRWCKEMQQLRDGAA